MYLYTHCLDTGISCGVPPPLENGMYTAEDFLAGSIITYQCNTGYYLLGDSRMLCTDSGKWNGISPSCLGESISIFDFIVTVMG